MKKSIAALLIRMFCLTLGGIVLLIAYGSGSSGLLKAENICNVSIVNGSWNEWNNDGLCKTDDSLLQERHLVQYDENNCNKSANVTFNEYRNASCDYCKEDIETRYSDWSQCFLNNTKYRTKYFVDNKYYFCCKVTELESDCSILKPEYENSTEVAECRQFNLTIISPNKEIYNTKKLNLSIISDKNLTKLEYTDYFDRAPQWRLLCKKCVKYNKTINVGDGVHNINIKGTLIDGRTSFENKSFIVDTKKPVIILPRIRSKGFTNGFFSINYTEYNLDEVTLIYDNENATKTDCLSGKNKNCFFNVDLSDKSGQEISYYFVIKDKAGNIEKSKVNRAIVDVIPPQIIDFSFDVVLNDIYFHFLIDELHFSDISFFDHSEKDGKWRVLCPNLKSGGICDKKQGFKPGEHNITIRISDKAGNFVTRDI